MRLKIILSFIACTFILGSINVIAGPPVKKVHAYKQASIPGIQPRFSETDGVNKADQRKQTFNYWIYLEIKGDPEISFSEIWIDGKKFMIKTEEIENTPVQKIISDGSSQNEIIILVPQTKRKVILVYPAGESRDSDPDSKKLTRLIKKNELVVVYTAHKGKRCYARSKHITMLKSDVHV